MKIKFAVRWDKDAEWDKPLVEEFGTFDDFLIGFLHTSRDDLRKGISEGKIEILEPKNWEDVK